MRVAVERAKWCVLAGVLAMACKVSSTQGTGDLADDLAQIEAELERTDARLGEAGIVVAYRDATTAAPAESPPQESPVAPDPTAPTTPTEPEAPPEPAPPPSTSPIVVDSPTATVPLEAEDAGPRVGLRRDRTGGSERKENRESRRRVKKATRTRCERVCELSETTCELQDRVCTLADAHVDDVRYEDACRRAEDQCEAATQSCESCAV